MHTTSFSIALCGKGGTGKTLCSALMTKCLLMDKTEWKKKILLIDADPAMGIPVALNLSQYQTIGQIREQIIQKARTSNRNEKQELANQLDYMFMEALIEIESLGILIMGHTDTLGCYCPLNNLLKDRIGFISQGFDVIIVDGEAGIEQINRQVMSSVDALVMVSDNSMRGLKTVQLIHRMAQSIPNMKPQLTGVIFNRVDALEESLLNQLKDKDIRLLGHLPPDPLVSEYDLEGRSLLELPGNSLSVQAMQQVLNQIIEGLNSVKQT